MKKNYKVLILTEEEWLEERKKTIGGSEVAALLNKSKWLTPNDLFNKLVYGKEKTFVKNDRMIEGAEIEKHIRALFAENFKKDFKLVKLPTRKKYFIVRTDKSYISVSPDALAINLRTKKQWGVEFKDVELRTSADINAWEGNLLPDQYFAQTLQYKVAKTDLEGTILYAHLHYFKKDDDTNEWHYDHSVLRPYFVYYDDTQVKSQVIALEEVQTHFYEFNVLGRHRPKTIISFK